MNSAFLEGGHSADIHEYFFQAAKYSDMEFVQLEGCVFVESQEWHFQVSKRWDNCSYIPQEGRFAYFHI